MAIGFECASTCSSFSFSDSLGTTFTNLAASKIASCSGESSHLYSNVAYGTANTSGYDIIKVNWSGSLPSTDLYGTAVDIMEAANAPYQASGINAGIGGSPSLSVNLSGLTGNIFIKFLTVTNIPDNPACDQSAGSEPGWIIWGGTNYDYGLYNTALNSSNFVFSPFTSDSGTDWIVTGAIFGSQLASTGVPEFPMGLSTAIVILAPLILLLRSRHSS